MVNSDPAVVVPAFKQLKASFRSGKTFDVKFRKEQLQNLYRGLTELSDKFCDALEKDLRLTRSFVRLVNIDYTLAKIKITIDNLSSWVKPISVDTPLMFAPAKSYIRPEPLGVVLTIGTWNYPIATSIPYVAAAIAAGNCVMLKPSEVGPYTSAVFVELFKYLDSDFYKCIEGEVEVTTEILKHPFDLIVFTGSPQVAKIISAAAAKHLTPTIMELGGKCPAIVNREANLNNAALRIARSRFINSGQTCWACDYVFVHKDIKARFLELLKEKIRQFYGKDPHESVDYSRIINTRNMERLRSYLDEDHGGKVLLGGDVRMNEKYIAPTIIDSPRPDSKVMQDEIFGPILPVYEFTQIEEVIEFINDRHKPLAAYYYGSARSDAYKQVRERVSSGALACNESGLQAINYHLPFGGVGNSGMGKVNGIHSFKAMSHMKSVMEANTNNSFPANALFPPFNKTTDKLSKYGMRTLHLTQNHVGIVLKLMLLFIMLLVLFKFSSALLGAAEGAKQKIGQKFHDL